MKYLRMVEIFVKPDLRDEIRQMKKELTYDEFLRELIKGVPVAAKATGKTNQPAKAILS